MNLPAYLKSLGYSEIPFVINRVNHIAIRAKVNGAEVVLIVDTGASRTCLAKSCAERLNLTVGKTEAVVSLALMEKTQAFCKLESIEIGSLHLTNFETWLIDFSYVNMIVQAKGEEICDGVLGADILQNHAAVIDYRCRKLYLQNE